MKLTATLGRYVSLLYFRNTALLLLALLGVVYLFDTVELIRRASKFQDFPLSLVFQMSLLKLPEVGQILFPFAVLFGAMFTFWQLNRRHELVVVRSAGFSVWQMLGPVIIVAGIIGVFLVTVINPIGALLLGKYEQLERSYLSYENSQIVVIKGGLWLRQDFADERDQGYVVLNAERVKQPEWSLESLKVFYFDDADLFLQRIDASEAVLEAEEWVFKDAVVHDADGQKSFHERYALPTHLTLRDVQDSFSSPSSMSFWQLPGYIKTLEETGFNTSSLRVHYQSLLAQPFLFIAMVLLAATVSMRPPRMHGGAMLLTAGVFIGFVVFFLSSFLQALGASQQIPVALSAWAPALICLMLGISMIIALEDG